MESSFTERDMCRVEGFYFLFKNYHGHTESQFSTVGDTIMTLFQKTLGEHKVG